MSIETYLIYLLAFVATIGAIILTIIAIELIKDIFL